jgi:diamine N-acetyltransferase
MEKENLPFNLKQCTTDDLDKLVWISRTTYYDTFIVSNTAEDMDIYLDTCMSKEVLGRELENQNSLFYLAYVNDELIGYLKLNTGTAQTETFKGECIELERLYILKDFHGKKYADMLMQKAIEFAKENNADFIWLGVWENNFRAIRFYEKKGFRKFGMHDFVMGTDVQTDFVMKLKLK